MSAWQERRHGGFRRSDGPASARAGRRRRRAAAIRVEILDIDTTAAAAAAATAEFLRQLLSATGVTWVQVSNSIVAANGLEFVMTTGAGRVAVERQVFEYAF